MQRRFAGSFLGLLVLVATMSPARANCLPNKTLTSWGVNGYFYVNMPAGATNANVIGRFWQAGGRALANEGTFDDTNWLRLYGPTQKWYILGELGTAGVFGCPAGSLIVTVDTLSGHSLTMQVDETPAGNAFDLSRFNTDLDFGTKPRPRVMSSSRAGTVVNLQLTVIARTAGIYTLGAAVAATPTYRLMSAFGSSDPGGLASAYTPGPAIVPGSPTSFPVDCSNPAGNEWIAIQEIVDGVPSDTVSPRTRLNCNPAMADPEYKQVDRPVRPERRGR